MSETSPLDFPIIAGDDTQITAKVLDKYTDQVPPLTSATAVITIYYPVTKALVTTIQNSSVLIDTVVGSLTFSIPGSATAGLPDGYYPWKAVVTLSDSTVHTYNNGDDDATIGSLNIVNRP